MISGDYYKLVGSYEGVVWHERAWKRFECESCLRELGIAKVRLQGPLTKGAAAALRSPIIWYHNKCTHAKYIAKHRQKR